MPSASSVFLNVRNLEKSLEFYKGLGFTVEREYRDDVGRLSYVDLAFGDAELSLGQILTDADEEYTRWVGNPELGAGVILYFEVADVDAVYMRAQDQRAAIEVPLRNRTYGRAFNLNDPDGYVVSFLAAPPRAARAAPAKPRARAAKPKPARKAPAAKRSVRAKVPKRGAKRRR